MFIELVALGANNCVHGKALDFFRMAIYKLAVNAILVHNQHNGNPNPSPPNLDFTDRMLKAGKFLETDVIDHLVITEKSYTSFADDGVIEQLRNSGLYELVEREKKDIREWRLSLAKEKAVKENKIAIAKKL